jgi:hypothetical protein
VDFTGLSVDAVIWNRLLRAVGRGCQKAETIVVISFSVSSQRFFSPGYGFFGGPGAIFLLIEERA